MCECLFPFFPSSLLHAANTGSQWEQSRITVLWVHFELCLILAAAGFFLSLLSSLLFTTFLRLCFFAHFGKQFYDRFFNAFQYLIGNVKKANSLIKVNCRFEGARSLLLVLGMCYKRKTIELTRLS